MLLTTNQFKEQMKIKNPNIEVLGNYVGDKVKIKVKCKICGHEWEDSPTHLKQNRGCSKCKKQIKKQLLQKGFIERSNLIHKNKYDYSQVNYIDQHTKVIITCPIHGDFEQTPNAHLRGESCPKCSHKSVLYTTQEWIEKARSIYEDKYDYSKVVYTGAKNYITIICPKHGEFKITPNNFTTNKHGCPKCAIEYVKNSITKSLNKFIQDSTKVHKNKYDYSKFEYINSKTKSTIICPKHGEFEQTPHDHLQGRGCPKCQLKSQTKLYEKLKESFPYEEILFEVGNNIISWLDGQRFDIYFPKYNIAVEYNGRQHYIEIEHFGGKLGLEDTQKRDNLKRQKCKENNCSLFEIKYNYTDEDYNILIKNIEKIISKG